MQPTPTTRKTITLSPDALATLALPLASTGSIIRDAAGRLVADVDYAYFECDYDAQIAAFIVDLVNEALTAAPGITIVPGSAAPISQLAPAPICDYDDCDQAALPGGDFCATHAAEHAENMAACEQVEPETPAEHLQQVTAAMEEEQAQ